MNSPERHLPGACRQNARYDERRTTGFLQLFNERWPYWAFFFNQVDDSIKLLGCCVCGVNFPGAGAIEIDGTKLVEFLRRGFGGMNLIFEKFGFPESELKTIGDGLLEVIEQSGMTTPI